MKAFPICRLLTALFIPALLFAAESDDSPEKIPPLQPPHGEILPDFWERNGLWVVVASLALVMLIGALVWYLSRPKPQVPVPPEVIARKALEQLRLQPEDGLILSRVSQVLRRYAAQVFALPTGELTTAEFCRALVDQPRVGPELAEALTGFLKQCDERKFAPGPPAPTLGAVSRALELITASQARVGPPPI